MPRRKIKADSPGQKQPTFPFSGWAHAQQHARFWKQSRSASTPQPCAGQAASAARPTAVCCLLGSCPGSHTAQPQAGRAQPGPGLRLPALCSAHGAAAGTQLGFTFLASLLNSDALHACQTATLQPESTEFHKLKNSKDYNDLKIRKTNKNRAQEHSIPNVSACSQI